MRGAKGLIWRAGLAMGVLALLPAGASATSPGTNGKIVYQSLSGTNGGGGLEIWMMNANGGNQHGLTDNTFNDERPAISTDASKVAFQSYRAGDGTTDSWEIYKMDSDGSNQAALTDDDDTDFNPAFSPDGTKIVYDKSGGDNTGLGQGLGADLWTVNTAGGGHTNLTNTANAYECCAEYSPDGSKIAFTMNGHYDNDPGSDYEPNNIFVMNSNGTGVTQLTFATGSEQNLEPTWSPDGSEIGYIHQPSGGNNDVWVMDADGDNPTQVTNTGVYEVNPVWSPDGSLIAFTQPASDNEIVTSPPVLSDPPVFTNLTNNVPDDDYASWAPGGASGGAPDTRITKKPADVIHKKKATFEFAADPPAGATFECKLDGAGFSSCASPKRYRNLSKGKHKFQVRATSAGGTDPTPAKDSFKVKP